MHWSRHSPPDIGGVDATSRRSREASFNGADGVVENGISRQSRPPRLRRSHPSCIRGGIASLTFIHSFIDRAYSLDRLVGAVTAEVRDLESSERMSLARDLARCCRLTGAFTLRSGQTSSVYFDKYQFEASPSILRRVVHQMVPLIPQGTEVLAGLELGGVPIATALSLETGIPAAFVRKSAKQYGTCRLAEGAEVNGKRICLVEDVITTGGQVMIRANELRNQGAIVTSLV